MSEKTIRVRYNRANICGLGPGVHLHPTSEQRPHNEVPLATWNSFKTHPQIRGLIDDGSIELLDEVDDTETEAPAPAAEPAAKRPRAPKQPKAEPAAPAPSPAAEPAPAAPSEADVALAKLGLS